MSLFQTKAWQSAWWETWGQQKSFRLIRKWDGEVSGLYESRYRLKGLLPVRSLQFVGTSHRELRTPRTEYNTFCNGAHNGASLVAAMEQVLERHPWTEIVFNDLLGGSIEVSALVTIAATHRWAFRIIASDDGYAVATTEDFRDYLAALGANSRRRLYNRRRFLESLGTVHLENLWPNSPELFFETLNRFHRARWDKDCVTDKSLEFHMKFLSRVEEEKGKPLLSVLRCNNKIVSVLYNVWYGGVVYNIQAGFEENFDKRLSLGSLHLGYAIEEAFNCPVTQKFDFLAGEGKNENYKSRFATESYQFISVMLVKSVLFRALYWMRG
ncbi:MAG: GNAT family N-acetyltransferase [Marinobacter sp.]